MTDLVLTAGVVAEAMSGRLVSGRPDEPISGVSIDSRTLTRGDLFIAIRGGRFDGHAFVEAALAAGAIGAVVTAPLMPALATWPPPAVLVNVDDTTRALQALARHTRRASGSQVVAITGSTGKTTTKEVTAAFLELRYGVIRSTGNLNNHIGLPLSLLDLRRRPDVAVVELGMSHAGEISTLVALAEPDVRVWTNVAEVHSAFFVSLDAIADAKAEVLEGATPRTLLVANADDPLVMERARRFAGAVRTFGTAEKADVQAGAVEDLGLGGMAASVRTPAGTARLRIPLLGHGNLANVLAAIAVALHYEVPLAQIVARAASLTAAPHRGVVTRLAGGVTLVDDSYNSNPRALEAALHVIAREARCGRRVAVLGEMLELGERSAALHAACGRAAASAGLDRLVTVGGEPARALGTAAIGAGMSAQAVSHVPTSAAAVNRVLTFVRPGDLVLVKGSRGIHTDIVVDRLTVEFG
ncbi:MAG: UDP-N-acetylmuramoyl-tripeptide--D-alanyl-D-alanine ligase [Acidobacteria bacterium]|nr:UDP-N-acetylmuramoyl-tripeptide--D-alanyl-D-alanine ligase [Acidobacteriota bacterium]